MNEWMHISICMPFILQLFLLLSQHHNLQVRFLPGFCAKNYSSRSRSLSIYSFIQSVWPLPLKFFFVRSTHELIAFISISAFKILMRCQHNVLPFSCWKPTSCAIHIISARRSAPKDHLNAGVLSWLYDKTMHQLSLGGWWVYKPLN